MVARRHIRFLVKLYSTPPILRGSILRGPSQLRGYLSRNFSSLFSEIFSEFFSNFFLFENEIL